MEFFGWDVAEDLLDMASHVHQLIYHHGYLQQGHMLLSLIIPDP